MPVSSVPSVATVTGNAAPARGQAADASLGVPLVGGGSATGKSPTSKKPAEVVVDFQFILAALQVQAPTSGFAPSAEPSSVSPAIAPDAGQTAAINANGTQKTSSEPMADSTAPSSPSLRLQSTAIAPGSSQSAEAALVLRLANSTPAIAEGSGLGAQVSSAKEPADANGQKGLGSPTSPGDTLTKVFGLAPSDPKGVNPKDGLSPGGDKSTSRVDKLSNLFGLAWNDSKGANAGEGLTPAGGNSYLPSPVSLGAGLKDVAGNPLNLILVDRGKSPEVSEPRNHASQSALKESSVQVRFASLELPLEMRTTPAFQDSHPLHNGSDVSGQIASGIIARAQIVTREGQTDFRLRLEPPELGTIQVHLSATDQGISARLVVHEEVAQQLIESQLESLRQRLTNAGISLGSFDVSQGGTGSRDAKKQRDPGSLVAPLGPGPSRPKPQPAQLGAMLRSTSTIDLVV